MADQGWAVDGKPVQAQAQAPQAQPLPNPLDLGPRTPYRNSQAAAAWSVDGKPVQGEDPGSLMDIPKGALAGGMHTVFEGGDLIRRAIGLPRVINNPDVQKEITPPDTLFGHLGYGGEQVGEAMVPLPGENAVKAIGAGKGLVKRALIHGGVDAAHNAVVAGVQSGGDPEAMITGGVIGGAVGAATGATASSYDSAARMTQDVTPERLEAARYGRANGVTVDPATRTGSPFLRNTKKFLSSGVNAPDAETMANTQAEQYGNLGRRLVNRLTGGGPASEPEQAGADAYRALNSKQESYSGEADQQFGGIRAQAKLLPNQQITFTRYEMQPTGQVDQMGHPIMAPKQVQVQGNFKIPVDRSQLQQSLRPLLQRFGTLSQAEQDASPALPIIRQIVNGDSVVEASEAMQDLSAMYNRFKLQRGEVAGDVNRFFGSKAMQQYRQTVDQSLAAVSPGLLDAANAGRAATGKKWGTIRLMNQLSGRVNPATPYAESSLEPVKVYENLTRMEDRGVSALRAFQAQAPAQIPKIASTVLQGLLDQASAQGAESAFSRSGTVLNKWNALGDGTKKILFGNMTPELDNFFRLGKYLSENPNPSNTGMHVWMAARIMSLFTHPSTFLKDVAVEEALGKYIFSDRGPLPYWNQMVPGMVKVNPAAAGAAAVWRQMTGQDPAQFTPRPGHNQSKTGQR